MQVEKQNAHFFGVTISDEQAEAGIVVRVTSAAQSKFKVHFIHLYDRYFHALCIFMPFFPTVVILKLSFMKFSATIF